MNDVSVICRQLGFPRASLYGNKKYRVMLPLRNIVIDTNEPKISTHIGELQVISEKKILFKVVIFILFIVVWKTLYSCYHKENENAARALDFCCHLSNCR